MAVERSGAITPGADRLFVYGTLKRGHPMHRLLAPFARYVAEGSICGKLYDLGAYPGVVEEQGCRHRVFGELYRLTDAAEAFRVLDAYEGSEYRRIELPVRLEGGRSVPAWVYLYVGPLEGAGWLKSGEWRPLRE
ncbi:gamma-glutamylcyclotransferase family protein [Hydrogenimonas sp. SS33]|uniref:gamma-glutamylcyclotransferase family protein n=1 Tax=Hydrogenimonas leucolamina TaxID=2954236 RepID=UPI00336BB8FD